MARKFVEIKRQRVESIIVRDTWLYDTEDVKTGVGRVDYFVSKQTKQPFLARFAGDESLVKEGEAFEWHALEFRVLANTTVPVRRPTDDDLFGMATEGFLEVKIAEEVIFEENGARIFGGFDFLPEFGGLAPGAAVASLGNGDHRNIRVLRVPLAVPGGRAFKASVQWTQAGGVSLGATRRLQMAVYGVIVIPTLKAVGEVKPG
jgi:hypothetical protein